MTQIRLRRDTSANFTTTNPVLGNGEPAYETDTKKLKIGDGTTPYNSLAYFAGSGGSAEFNVVQPLKLVDGTLTLQIDEQTIQVQNGKLVANLDELGNEVNDLSGRVTAVEVDVLKKENKITPVVPITLREEIRSNLSGMSYTSDGTRVYSTNNTTIDYDKSPWKEENILGATYVNNSGYFEAGEYTADSWAGGYIDMPYTFGHTVKIPHQYDSTCAYAGKYDMQGRFIPITRLAYDHNSKPITYSDNLTLEVTTNQIILKGQADSIAGRPTSITTSGGRQNHSWTINNKPYDYLQWVIESDGSVTQIDRDNTTDTRCYVATSANASPLAIERWKEVTVIRFTPTTRLGSGTYGALSNPFVVSSFGVYPTTKRIYEYATENELLATGNLFDISGEQSQNYLSLNIGDGLTITEGKLTATGGGSSAPENMVTTDTSQIITGRKIFKNDTTFYYPLALDCLENNARFDVIHNKYGSGAVTTEVLLGLYLDEYRKNIIFGLRDSYLQLNGTLEDENSNRILTQGNVTAGDNVTITKTRGGIQISATGGTNNALDVDLSNISATGKSKASDYAFPSDTYVELTLGASGSTYTAPTNGYFVLAGRLSAPGQIVLHNTSSRLQSSRWIGVASGTASIAVLAKRNDTVVAAWDNTLSINEEGLYFKFVYAEGEVK